MDALNKGIASTALTAFLSLGIIGCQSLGHIVTSPEQAVTLPLSTDKLQNYVWQLISVTDHSGKPTATGLFYNASKPLLVKFDKEGKVRLTNTCNKMWADYMLTNDNIIVGDFASTRMMCSEPALMTFDQLAPSVLQGQYKLTQTRSGEPVLTITHGNQINVLKPVAKKQR